MAVLITEVTEMNGDNYCVAGWDTERAEMVRPLPNGNNWSQELITEYQVEPGILMNFIPNGEHHNGSFPHTTEDLRIDQEQIGVIGRDVPCWLGPESPSRARTIGEAFDNNIRYNNIYQDRRSGVHIMAGTHCRSLWGLEIPRPNIVFISDKFKDRPASLKAQIDDGAAQYTLPVSDHALRQHFRDGGVDAVTNLLPNNGQLHIRLGLARPFGDPPEKCYLMVNGVHW